MFIFTIIGVLTVVVTIIRIIDQALGAYVEVDDNMGKTWLPWSQI